MHVFIVYAHPSKESFTYQMKETFIQSLIKNHHTYEISDLYEMNFNETLSEAEYLREAFYDRKPSVPNDVLLEQAKIQKADIIVFIYPVFWTECPAILTGWFQRVWTYGFAYGENAEMKKLEKALFLVSMGGDLQDPIHKQQVQAMETVMLQDRINERAKEKEMIIFELTSRDIIYAKDREQRFQTYLTQIESLGKL